MVGVAGCGVDGNGGIVHINRAVDGWWIYMIVPQFGVIFSSPHTALKQTKGLPKLIARSSRASIDIIRESCRG